MDDRDGGSETDWLCIMNDARRRYWEEHGENAAGAGKDGDVVNAAVDAVVREREEAAGQAVLKREQTAWLAAHGQLLAIIESMRAELAAMREEA